MHGRRRDCGWHCQSISTVLQQHRRGEGWEEGGQRAEQARELRLTVHYYCFQVKE